jgi:hypothetical protein
MAEFMVLALSGPVVLLGLGALGLWATRWM